MSGVTLSVVIPSLGRRSLADAVASCQDADEILVGFDGAESAGRAPELPERVRVFVTEPTGRLGGWQRTTCIKNARMDLVAFMDDDDVYLPDGIQLIKTHADPARLNIFRTHHTGTVVWHRQDFRVGEVSSLGICVPNRPDLPEWPMKACGDFYFADACTQVLGEPVWHDHIVASCVRSGGGRLREEDL